MSKYIFDDNMREISGFGGEYEKDCRMMITKGLELCDEKGWNYETFRCIFGKNMSTALDTSAQFKELTDYMNEAIKGEATGAMMGACVGHLFHILQIGWDNYKIYMVQAKKEEEDCIEEDAGCYKSQKQSIFSKILIFFTGKKEDK